MKSHRDLAAELLLANGVSAPAIPISQITNQTKVTGQVARLHHAPMFALGVAHEFRYSQP